MANNGVPITFLDIHCNSFYFTEEKDDWETDAFRQSGKVSTYRIKSRDNKSLILNAEEDFQFENSTGHQFNIQTYNSTDLRKIKGRAVMLYVYKNQKKMVACCCGNSEIRAKEMVEIPTDLHKTSDEALFYMVKLSAPSSYQFESTLYPGRFLGFQHDGNNASRHKLVLIQGRNEVDNFCPMQMEKF
uniref:Interleukin-18 n=1 Tax=Amphiprion percula TaxID=161767 RepID=A0A3P8S4K8_AMPPE